ncbi:hypothetical protein [Enterocloster bolteae]|uniref:hypothetical protein n=1 Tax=Enterocloster bolteae TaxID=208479 RepID=UPI003A7F560B
MCGDGGYFVAPSRIHENGNRYEWEQAPDEFVIEKAAGITLFSAWPAVYKPKDCQMRPFWLQQ